MIPITVRNVQMTIIGTPLSIDGDKLTIILDAYINQFIVPMDCVDGDSKKLIMDELAKQNKPKKRGKR